MKTVSIDCYPEVIQKKGNGECIGVPQERKDCYRQVVTCSGMRTENIDCYPEIEQAYQKGEIHPLDLKKACGECLIEVLRPVREYIQ